MVIKNKPGDWTAYMLFYRSRVKIGITRQFLKWLSKEKAKRVWNKKRRAGRS